LGVAVVDVLLETMGLGFLMMGGGKLILLELDGLILGFGIAVLAVLILLVAVVGIGARGVVVVAGIGCVARLLTAVE